MSDWNPNTPDSTSVPPPLSSGGGTATATCVECGKTFPADEMIRHGEISVCAACKPVFMQKLAEGARIDQYAFRYAGFWIRCVAMLVDMVFLFGAMMIIALIAGVAMGTMAVGNPKGIPQSEALIFSLLIDLAILVLFCGYEIFMVGKWGATLGKMLCKIKIVTAEGGRVTYLRALARLAGYWLSGLIFYIGYIMAAFDPEKRALHDRICNTRVIYK